MRYLHLGLVFLIATGALSALAQTIDSQDIAATKSRSEAMREDAEALSAEVKSRGDAFRKEAAELREGGVANMRKVAETDLPTGPKGAIDFDEIVEGAARNSAVPAGDAPQFIAFASLSMPPASLRRLIEDTSRAGGVVVFRGFPNNSAKEFVARLGKVVSKDQMASVGIDPRLFRAFGIQAVPTYVAVSSDFDVCAGFVCQTLVPPHDRLAGNVTVEYALSSFAQANGPGARIAQVALRNLDRSNP